MSANSIQHVLSLKAYERKSELGGGFRARVVWRMNNAVVPPQHYATVYESEILDTFDQAKSWAMQTAAKIMGDRPYRRCYIKSPRNLYRANVWA